MFVIAPNSVLGFIKSNNFITGPVLSIQPSSSLSFYFVIAGSLCYVKNETTVETEIKINKTRSILYLLFYIEVFIKTDFTKS